MTTDKFSLPKDGWADPTLVEFRQIASPTFCRRVKEEVAQELTSLVRGRADLAPLFQDREWEVEDLAPLLKGCQELVTGVIARQAANWNSRKWLWFTRRVPWWAIPASSEGASGEGRYDFYAESLIDSLTAWHGHLKPTPPHEPRFEYEISPSNAKKVIALCSRIAYLTYVQRLLLATGRGAKFHGQERLTLLPLENAEYLRQRTIYIKRTLLAEVWPGPFVALGASAFQDADPVADDTVWLGIKLVDPTSLPVPFEDYGLPSRSFARFFFLPRTLAPIKAFAENLDPANRHWATEHLSAVLIMLRLARGIISDPSTLTTFYHFGYATASVGFWKEYLSVHFDDARSFVAALLPHANIPSSPELLVQQIQELPVGIWPIRRGSGIRVDAERVTIDLYGITASLKDQLTIHSSIGELGQLRGRAFEDDVQAAIDGTPWRPSPDIVALRRRTLRLSGRDLTDIDAIAVKDNRLLIVSCKSKGLTPQLETALVSATRNAESMIEAAYVDAIRLEDLLRLTPKGDNFDFSMFDEILIHVCIPYPLFVAADRLLEPIRDGLMRCVSLAELHTWLSLGSVDLDDPLGHRVIKPVSPFAK